MALLYIYCMKQQQLHGLNITPGNEPLSRPGIYVITHLPTGRSYVGISSNLFRRLGEHARGRGGVVRLQQAFDQHGLHEFLAEPVFYMTVGTAGLAEIEAQMIASRNSVANGFNTAEASSGVGKYGPRFSASIKMAHNRPEVKATMAATNARPEVSAKRSAALLRSHSCPVFRANRSAASLASNAGERLHTPDARAKNKMAINSPEGKASRSAARLRYYANPENRATHLNAVRKANANPERNAKLSASRMGRIWITDGSTRRAIKAGEAIPNGWRRGRRLDVAGKLLQHSFKY